MSGQGSISRLNDPRVRGLLTNIYVFLLVNLVIWVFIRPVITDINRIKNERKQYQGLKQQLELKVERLGGLLQEVQSRRQEINYLPLLYPNDYNFSYLLTILGRIAEEVGVDLVSINFNEQVSGQLAKKMKTKQIVQVTPVTFNVTFNGSYSQMMHYVRRLEQTAFLPQIVALDYSERDIEQEKQEKSYTITFVVYRSNNKIIENPAYGFSQGR